MKRLKVLVIMLLLVLSLCGCAKGEANDRNFKRLKPGMTPDKVHEIMGKPDDTQNEQFFEFQYWFDGASSIKDAQKKYEKGVAVKYYCVVFFAEDKVTYVIESKEDIISGVWGKY